jgi:hypothetical protein
MAYPTISSPYGFIPQNLLGSQVNTNGTREYPIQYAYATDIFFGDFVGLSRGFINRVAVASGTGLNQMVGVFLGCSFTNPVTRQKVFSQNWPTGTLAGDAVAIVADDPDLVFKAAVCISGTTIASAAFAMIGQNLSAIDNASGNLLNGNSRNAVLAPSATPVTTTLPLRVIDLVRETAIPLGTATYASISTNTITVSAIPFALPRGTDVASVAANGQIIRSGSFVVTAASAGATTVVLNQPPSPAIVASSTVAFTQYQEVLVKLQFGAHGYYSATGIA